MKQNLIVYPGGCYGTFFEWIFNFLENSSIPLPFVHDGSSHEFHGNLLYPKEKLFAYITSGHSHRFSRAHPGLFENNQIDHSEYHRSIEKDLNFLSEHFDKILAISYSEDSVLWQQNNGLDKTYLSEETFENELGKYGHDRDQFRHCFERDPVKRIKQIIAYEVNSEFSPLTVQNLMGWHKNNINDFDIWELRELLSFYWFTRSDGEIAAWRKNAQLNSDKIMFINIDDIKHNFLHTVKNAAGHFGVPMGDDVLDSLQQVHAKWLNLQKQINKDSLCRQIVDALLQRIPFDWNQCNLSLIDEAWIQKTLRDHNVEIKCQDLNVFPTNTDDFLPLLQAHNEHWTEPENTVSS